MAISASVDFSGFAPEIRNMVYERIAEDNLDAFCVSKTVYHEAVGAVMNQKVYYMNLGYIDRHSSVPILRHKKATEMVQHVELALNVG